MATGYIWRDWGRTEPEGDLARDLSPYELAYLNGKQARVVELAVTSLVKSNVITIEPGQPWTVVSPQPQVELDPIEKRVLNSIHSGIQLPQLRQQKCGRIESLRLQLQQNGLIVSEAKAQQIQSRSILLMGSFLSLGIVRLILGVMKGRPVGFLIMMMILFGLFGLGLWFAPKRTKKGDRAVKSAKARYAYIDPKKTSTIDLDKQVLLSAVAIYGGTVLLTDPALASLGRIMVPLSSSSSSDFGGGDSGGGCGGGGCGGGGCGG